MDEERRKVCIITGASSGLGWAAAKKLVAKNYHTIFACRDEGKTLSLLQKLKEESGRSNFEFLPLDLASFDSIRRFVDEFHRRGLPLHVLINNAGIFAKTFQKSADGIELTFAVNHLGHCQTKRQTIVHPSRSILFRLVLLTNLLLDDLKGSAPSRVVVVSSKLHDAKSKVGPPPNFKWTLDEMNNEAEYDTMVAYKNSKLANVWFAYELARRLENTGVDVNVLCPVKRSSPSSLSLSASLTVSLFVKGFVPTTGLSRESNAFQRFFMSYVMPLFPFTRSASFID